MEPDNAVVSAFFYPSENTIDIHEALIGVPSIYLNEYTKYALDRNGHAETVKNLSIIHGVSDYLAASFLDDPFIGEGTGKLFKRSTSYLRRLDNDVRLSADDRIWLLEPQMTMHTGRFGVAFYGAADRKLGQK